MRVVIAPDKFKGTATAGEIAAAIASAVTEAGHEPVTVPMADGGDGTLAALGGSNRTTTVTGPDGSPVDAPWRLSKRLAVIEMALGSGLVLAGGAEENDPLNATTRGTGELIEAAIARGAQRIIVGLGGSATTDGGWGAIRAMPPAARMKEIELIVATDVRTSFVDAAPVFGPQKGLSPAQVALLERRLERLVQVYRDRYDVDVVTLAGAGAAGGLAGGLVAVGGRIESGFDVVAENVRLDEHLVDADLVVTGEGFLDAESFNGKVVGGVSTWAAEMAVPVLAIVGDADLDSVTRPGHVEIVSLTERHGLDRAMDETLRLVELELDEYLGGFSRLEKP